MPAGRPKLAIDIEQVEKLAGIGCNLRQICDYLGVSIRTIQRSAKTNKEVEEALSRGRSRSVVRWAQRMADLADEGNFGALKFLLTTQGGGAFSEKKEVEAKVSVSGAATTPAMQEVLDLAAEAAKEE